MHFPSKLIRGTLLKRYLRFLADVRLDDGTELTATCPNTGSMIGLKQPGMAVWLSTSESATRKYKHTLELVETDMGRGTVLVGINTQHPNKLVEEAILSGHLPTLTGYESLKREQKYGVNSRIDLLLEDPGKGRLYVEVKNVHLSRTAGRAEFPDSVTERGTKHLGELGDMVEAGHRAVQCFLIQRADCEAFSIAADVDANYAEALARAQSRGVEILCLRCEISPERITANTLIPFVGPSASASSKRKSSAPKPQSTAPARASAANRRSRKKV